MATCKGLPSSLIVQIVIHFLMKKFSKFEENLFLFLSNAGETPRALMVYSIPPPPVESVLNIFHE